MTVSELTVLLPKAGRTGYMSPWEWRQTRLHEGRWTLQPGDVLVPGRCSVEVEESIGELMERCDRVAVIGAVTDFDGPGEMSHWEVTAR